MAHSELLTVSRDSGGPQPVWGCRLPRCPQEAARLLGPQRKPCAGGTSRHRTSGSRTGWRRLAFSTPHTLKGPRTLERGRTGQRPPDSRRRLPYRPHTLAWAEAPAPRMATRQHLDRQQGKLPLGQRTGVGRLSRGLALCAPHHTAPRSPACPHPGPRRAQAQRKCARTPTPRPRGRHLHAQPEGGRLLQQTG